MFSIATLCYRKHKSHSGGVKSDLVPVLCGAVLRSVRATLLFSKCINDIIADTIKGAGARHFLQDCVCAPVKTQISLRIRAV